MSKICFQIVWRQNLRQIAMNVLAGTDTSWGRYSKCRNLAMSAPARTAPPVQMAWPRHPPRMTPTWRTWEKRLIDWKVEILLVNHLMPQTTSLMPARTMVASWDLSPHSAMKVRVKVFTNSWWHIHKLLQTCSWCLTFFAPWGVLSKVALIEMSKLGNPIPIPLK